MSVLGITAEEIERYAYRQAWDRFNSLPHLSPDEKIYAPGKLRDYIKLLVATGERDIEKIATSAMGLIREYHQIARSQARVESPATSPQ